MKKFLNTMLVTAAVVSAASVASAATAGKVAQGAYLGASAGMANTNVKYNWVANNPTLISAGGSPASETRVTKTDNGKNAGIFGLVTGYNFQSGSLVFGGEIYGGLDSTKVTAFDDSGSGTSTNNALWTATVKRTNFFGFAPRLGFMVAPNTLMYARLGVEFGKWKAKVDPSVVGMNAARQAATALGAWTAATQTQINDSSASVSSSKGGMSFAPGLGMEVYMGKAFLRAQYSYLFGPKITLTQNTQGYDNYFQVNGSSVTHTFKTSQHKVELAVGYKF